MGPKPGVTSETARTFPLSSELGLLMSILPISLGGQGLIFPLPTGFLENSRSCPHLGQEGHQRTVAIDYISDLKDKRSKRCICFPEGCPALVMSTQQPLYTPLLLPEPGLRRRSIRAERTHGKRRLRAGRHRETLTWGT